MKVIKKINKPLLENKDISVDNKINFYFVNSIVKIDWNPLKIINKLICFINLVVAIITIQLLELTIVFDVFNE